MIPFLTKQNVLVFKTNIQTKSEARKLQPVMNKKSILKWNIDLEDKDKVLRVVTGVLTPNDIIAVTKQKGFECAELE